MILKTLRLALITLLLSACQYTEKSSFNINNANFHGLGQEPGWRIDIDPQKGIDYLGDYGETKRHFNFVQASLAQNNLIYQLTNKDHQLIIKLVNTICEDAMSGKKFPITVQLTLDHKQLNGCGYFR